MIPSARDPRRDNPARSTRPEAAAEYRRVSCSFEGEGVANRAPAEIAQQPTQPALGSMQVQIVAEARLQTDAGNARLLRIDLPRMHVEDRRLAIDPIHTFDRPARDAIRRQAEVTAAT